MNRDEYPKGYKIAVRTDQNRPLCTSENQTNARGKVNIPQGNVHEGIPTHATHD